VYGVAGVQLRTIRERLTRKSEAMIQAVGVIFQILYARQKDSRDHFLLDFECCCAGANDFVRMSEKCEDIIQEIQIECQLTAKQQETLDDQAGALLNVYNIDAVYSAQKTIQYIFADIAREIEADLFTIEWLDELQDNDLAVTMIATIEDYMGDLQKFLDEVMMQKVMEALVAKSIVFYIGQLLDRAEKHKSGRDSFFADNQRALLRMSGDMEVIKEYFDGYAEEDFPTLNRTIEKEFAFFETVHEVMKIAAGVSGDDIRTYIFAFQERIQQYDITISVIGDLYHLANPGEEKKIYEAFKELEEDLKELNADDKSDPEKERETVSGLRLDTMMKNHCQESTRSRPKEGGWSLW
jgi:hypothetical protein